MFFPERSRRALPRSSQSTNKREAEKLAYADIGLTLISQKRSFQVLLDGIGSEPHAQEGFLKIAALDCAF